MAPMTPMTPPPTAKGTHRRVQSTPDHVSSGSSGDDALLSTSPEPSTPISPDESRHGGISLNPGTPITPPLTSLACSEKSRDDERSKVLGSPGSAAETKPIYNFEIFTESPDKPADCPTPPSEHEVAVINARIAKDSLKPATRRASLFATRSDPAGLYSMTDSELSQPIDVSFVQGYYDRDIFSPSSHFAESRKTESHNTASHKAESPVHPTSTNDFSKSSPLAGSASPDEITPANAQSFLPPDACLFVASLTRDKTDSQLHRALSAEFQPHGKCYVKVKRARGMPVAFVQYHDRAMADRAMELTKGNLILGRPCRIEKARAPRCVFISRRDGQCPSEDEVISLAMAIGQIEKTWAPTETERERHGLAPGFCCRFAFYQDAANAIALERKNAIYHVESFHAADRLEGIYAFHKSSYLLDPNALSTCPRFNPVKHVPHALWVGKLPPTMTKLQLFRVFDNSMSRVTEVHLNIRRNSDESALLSHATIYFADWHAALRAALCTHNRLRLTTGEMVQIEWRLRPFRANSAAFDASNISSPSIFGNGLTNGGLGIPSPMTGFHNTAFGLNIFPGSNSNGIDRLAPLPMYRPTEFPAHTRQPGPMSPFALGGLTNNPPYIPGTASGGFSNGPNSLFNGVYPVNNGGFANSGFHLTNVGTTAGYPVANGTYFTGRR